MEPESLIHRYLIGEASPEEVEELDRQLASDPGLRKRLVREARLDAGLREIALERASGREEETAAGCRSRRAKRSVLWTWGTWAAAAALLAVGFVTWMQRPSGAVVATIASSEGASWESSVPTVPGSALPAGYLKLRSGIATVEFRSGARVRIESPAHLVLETPMRGRLLEGAAIVDVPDRAIGFVLETPGSHAVDHGTRFAVSVDEEARTSAFEVLSGEISVHHPGSGESVRLSERESILAQGEGLLRGGQEPGEKGRLPGISTGLRLATSGREATVIRNGEHEDRIHPDFLMAKRSSFLPGYDRRSVFAFDLADVDGGEVEGVRLRLNLVPCGLGFAARLPEESKFSLYGIVGRGEFRNLRWEEAPQPEEGTPVGTFTIPRSRRTGNFSVESDALTRFVRAHAGEPVTFLLVRDTDEAMGNGLVHAFASSRHPEASGPILEIN